MPETPSVTSVQPISMTRRRVTRSAAAVASSGLIVGMGAVGAAPAVAAEASDCTAPNTVNALTGDETDIQALLDAETAIVCIEGSFVLTQPLAFDHNLTLFGLTGAELDGNDLTQLVVGSLAASLTVQSISFTDGFSDGSGGAIAVDGELSVENSQFTGNTASDFGGAVFNASGSTFNVVGSIFTNNSASLGGAVYGSGIIFDESTFTGNGAQAGGAVFADAILVSESTFAENSASAGGAILAQNYSAIAGSTFVENVAGSIGGAVATYGFYLGINSTFVENTAGDVGGALFAGYGESGLSTFLNNQANSESIESESIFASGADENSFELGGNIFAGSGSSAQLGADGGGLYVDNGGNVFSTSASTESALGTPDATSLFSRSIAEIFGANPLLANNGGATQTVALIGSSPAINAVPADYTFGSISATLAPIADRLQTAEPLSAAVDTIDVDQRNEARTGRADAGAYEFGEPELAATGADANAAGWIGGLAALLLGAGASIVFGSRLATRRSARVSEPASDV